MDGWINCILLQRENNPTFTTHSHSISVLQTASRNEWLILLFQHYSDTGFPVRQFILIIAKLLTSPFTMCTKLGMSLNQQRVVKKLVQRFCSEVLYLDQKNVFWCCILSTLSGLIRQPSLPLMVTFCKRGPTALPFSSPCSINNG